MMPGPGQYPYRAEFLANKEDGEGRLKWRVVSTRFCSREDTGGVFQEAASNVKQFCKIRTRLVIRPLDVEQRIRIGDKIYSILNIKHDRDKQETELTCSTAAVEDEKA